MGKGARGDAEGGNGEGKIGREQLRGRGRGGQAHTMPGWNEVTVFSDFVYPCNAGYPQLVYTNKIGDCLFICLFIYLSICSAIGGQTARPKRLKLGG